MAERGAAGLRWTPWDWFPGSRQADLATRNPRTRGGQNAGFTQWEWRYSRSAAIPMGRNGRSVKPSAKPTLVRTQHLPPPAEMARELGIPGLAGHLALVPPCFMMCRCEPLRSSGYGHMADGIGPGASGSPNR